MRKKSPVDNISDKLYYVALVWTPWRKGERGVLAGPFSSEASASKTLVAAGFVDYGIVHDHGPARMSGRIYPGWRVADDCKEIEWQRHSLLPPHRVKACVLQQGRRNQGTAHSVRDGYGYVHEWTQ
ncbi:MAG TPA: hypothetical protein VMJ72_01500 [Candidatus Paceibacterota bacterium]|nr:hypothetical protein [Candidatus Paceibacterota bacterium]